MRALAECDTTDSVKLQLQWFIQSQFAGYFAAQDKGFYAEEGLDVALVGLVLLAVVNLDVQQQIGQHGLLPGDCGVGAKIPEAGTRPA